jgi:hypothetical protein
MPAFADANFQPLTESAAIRRAQSRFLTPNRLQACAFNSKGTGLRALVSGFLATFARGSGKKIGPAPRISVTPDVGGET